MQIDYAFLESVKKGIQVDFEKNRYVRDQSIPHAPCKNLCLNKQEQRLALKNALRYFESDLHERLAPEFLYELQTYGHIYMYRLIPNYEMKAYPYDKYPCKCKQAQVIMHMIMNNLNHEVAQFPHELITYGGNGSVFQNWAQYHLTMKYLSEMNEHQTLVMNSGHPQGLFPSHPDAPRIVLSNGMMIPNYSTQSHYEKHYALGNTMYGQMTAGSYCYIGSQGIVHGTTLTLLNAARKYLKTDSLNGVVFVSSGLGGMSGAQPKAGDILGCISVIAEVSEKALDKRLKQGWVKKKITDVEQVITEIKLAKQEKRAESIGFLGNIVLLWERLAQEEINLVDLGSDQTSLHNPFNGGYYPVQLQFEEANEMMVKDPEQFKKLVYESLIRQVDAINKLTQKGMHFWDYGNRFLLESRRAGANVNQENDEQLFRYPSYFQDIMGDIFSLGFGPFRWICTSGRSEDLQLTDKIAEQVLIDLITKSPKIVADQLNDNLDWIRKADENKLVIGSQARILYADTQARTEIALRFNEAVKQGQISGPIVLSRDHHDVSGTDSPYRETADIYDGSQFTADMAVQNVIGDSFRGATWVALHNGGGVGWGEVINGGFGLVLDGSDDASRRAKMMLQWDVNNGVSRRSWCGNQNAQFNIKRQMEMEPLLKVTIPYQSDVVDKLEF
ncbi:unnamed protein product [Paramecium pentaurelia]|uniref:urocanate hydratase n=1 Tax=Paramecium pentaurelia TaxID=43138 RepID=A0A8S1V789_9CILI|nr:unnamed protein product [Paramecium pentaurelia]